MIPVLCKASGILDPAIASGPFVTMVCDLSASLIFLFLVFALLT
jgi:Mg/Co/Ni transporter MgtE